MEKISVKEYLENKKLLEIIYTQYDLKNDVCDAILSKVIVNNQGYECIDSALLSRVKTQIFIEQITNLDLSILDENNLNGFDLLCLNNELDNLVELIVNEYKRFDDILCNKVNDFKENRSSLKGYLHSVILTIKVSFDEFMNKTSEYINNIDSEKISNDIKDIISNKLKEK